MKLTVIQVDQSTALATHVIAKSMNGFAIRLVSKKKLEVGDEVDLPPELAAGLPTPEGPVEPRPLEDLENADIISQFKIQDLEATVRRQNSIIKRMSERLAQLENVIPIQVPPHQG